MQSKLFPLMRRNGGIGNANTYKIARISVKNRYKYDYSAEDGYFEKEMTYLEAKKIMTPVPHSFMHKRPPMDILYPVHWNDVRFNHHPGFFGRRCFIHDTYFPKYDIDHDIPHSLGFRDEDLDYELPDPIDNMHFKRKRSQFTHMLIFVMWACAFFGYAICGLKLPQTNNPFYWRKKYASNTSMFQLQQVAAADYGDAYDRERAGFKRLAISGKGLELRNQGIRFDFAGNNKLYY